jgi:RNA recognition motif-containing protein
MCDATTGRSKGFGFVRFGDEGQRDKAIQEMNGTELHGRTIRLSIAAKRSGGAQTERDAFSTEVTQVQAPSRKHL